MHLRAVRSIRENLLGMIHWESQRQVHLLLQLLGLTIALSAIVTLQVCHASAFSPVTDADARMITEQRSITEIVTTPGIHILHKGYELANACETCAPPDSQPDRHERTHAGDIAQRFAALPTTISVHVAQAPRYGTAQLTPRLTEAMTPESPPPQSANWHAIEDYSPGSTIAHWTPRFFVQC